jgi:hypothetical protein
MGLEHLRNFTEIGFKNALVMFQYADQHGNVFVLDTEDASKLCFMAATPLGSPCANASALEQVLTLQEYMGLISAFSLAIDNKICHCELRSKHSGMIIALEDGQQRRYILSPGSKERLELEGLLCGCLHGA